MKSVIFCRLVPIAVFCSAAIWLSGCTKYKTVADAVYPPQRIYLPAAVEGNYVINSVAQPNMTPVANGPSQYIVDADYKNFMIPLTVYRSGVNNKGSISFTAGVDNDTVNTLINSGLLNAVVLPATAYTLDVPAAIGDGQDYAALALVVNLDFLRADTTKIYAVAIGISGDKNGQAGVSPGLGRVIVVIDAHMIKPAAGFTSNADASAANVVNFTNTSTNALKYVWNYGDGSTSDTIPSPAHTYSGPGSYMVSLTATGITGEKDKSVATSQVIIP